MRQDDTEAVIRNAWRNNFKTFGIYYRFVPWFKKNRKLILTINLVVFAIMFIGVATNMIHRGDFMSWFGFLVYTPQIITVFIVGVDHMKIGASRRAVRADCAKHLIIMSEKDLNKWIKQLDLKP